jgi:error-prone DNA polymerase
MTIEDETDVANLVIWSSVFERQRRLILSSGMIGCRGRVQREGQVIHVVAEHLIDLSDLLRSVGERQAFTAQAAQKSQVLDSHRDSEIKVQTRSFR